MFTYKKKNNTLLPTQYYLVNMTKLNVTMRIVIGLLNICGGVTEGVTVANE